MNEPRCPKCDGVRTLALTDIPGLVVCVRCGANDLTMNQVCRGAVASPGAEYPSEPNIGGGAGVAPGSLPQGELSEAAKQLALAGVLWDGANADGECAFCGEVYFEEETFILHTSDCPVVRHRLELIAQLVTLDPAPETPEGERLKELAEVQQKYEVGVGVSRPGGTPE